MRRLITLTAISTFALLLALPALAQNPTPYEGERSFERGPDGRKGGRSMRGERGLGISPRMAEELELSEEQTAAIKAIRDAFHEESSEARAAVADIRSELRELWSADEPDKEAILAKMDEMQAEKRAMSVARVEAKLDVLAVLSAEQKAEMQVIKSERRERRSERRSEARSGGEGKRGGGDCDGDGDGRRSKRSRGSWGD